MTRAKTIEIRPIDSRPADTEFDLRLYDKARVCLVNIIPLEHSDEVGQDSEPFLAVHPDGQLLVCGAYTFSDRQAPPELSPLYVSTDGGWTWARRYIVPEGRIASQSFCFSGAGRTLYGAIGRSPEKGPGAVAVLATQDPTQDRPMEVISTLGSRGHFADQPFIQARAFNPDRIYVGQNYFGPELGSGKTASVRVSTDGGKKFRLLGVEARTTSGQDAPSVRPSIAKDGSVYVAFMRWTASSGEWGAGTLKCTGDVIVTRDDEGAIGSRAFRSLTDPQDRKPGRIVARACLFPFSGKLGEQRIGSSLSLAVDANNSAVVYVAWADQDPSRKAYTLHLRKSTDRGQNWSDDLLTIPSATNPAVAVSDEGAVGFLYQSLLSNGKRHSRWETHFQWSPDGVAAWTDILLTTFPNAVAPKRQFDPYLGDKLDLVSVATSFYGSFSAPNIPRRKYFPQGVHFQRRHRNGKLLANDPKRRVQPSIDPYFFCVQTGGGSVRSKAVDRLIADFKGPALANFTGFVAATFTDTRGRGIREAAPGETVGLTVQFGQKASKDSWSERIDIREGQDVPQVTFKISVDGGDFDVAPDSRILVVAAPIPAVARFEVVSPQIAGTHSLFIQVFQATRLVQVVAATLTVRNPEKR